MTQALYTHMNNKTIKKKINANTKALVLMQLFLCFFLCFLQGVSFISGATFKS
jgi:hypothetical protein